MATKKYNVQDIIDECFGSIDDLESFLREVQDDIRNRDRWLYLSKIRKDLQVLQRDLKDNNLNTDNLIKPSFLKRVESLIGELKDVSEFIPDSRKRKNDGRPPESPANYLIDQLSRRTVHKDGTHKKHTDWEAFKTIVAHYKKTFPFLKNIPTSNKKLGDRRCSYRRTYGRKTRLIKWPAIGRRKRIVKELKNSKS